MRELCILGASGHGKVVYDIAMSMERYEKVYFFDDAASLGSTGGNDLAGEAEGPRGIVNGIPVEGNLEALLQKFKEASGALGMEAIVAVGDNQTRRRLQERLEWEGVPVALLVHASAVVSEGASIGPGTVAMPGAVVNRGAAVGKGCILNTCSSVDHDCRVGDYCHISVGSHLAGTVRVGGGTFVGIGAAIKNNISICGGCLIGAGAVVVSDIKEPGTYVGAPAKQRNCSKEREAEAQPGNNSQA